MLGRKVLRKLKRKFINRFGVDAVHKRFDKTNIPLDDFGEPIGDADEFFAETTLRIVIDTDRMQVDETLVGGLPESNNKEILYFYCAGDADVRTGDKILYPIDTPNEWIVFFVSPNILDGVDVINEVKCHRDRRY